MSPSPSQRTASEPTADGPGLDHGWRRRTWPRRHSRHRGAAQDTGRTGPEPPEMTVFAFSNLQSLEGEMDSTEKAAFSEVFGEDNL